LTKRIITGYFPITGSRKTVTGRQRLFMERQYLYLCAIVVISLFLRLAYVVAFEAEITPGDDPSYYVRTAENIVDGEGYHSENLLAYQPPLYPYFMAGVFAVSGRSIDAVRIVQVFLGSIMCLVLFFIGRMCASKRAGLIAAGLCAVYPALIHYSVQIWSEQLFTFLMIMAVLCLLVSERRSAVPWRIVTGIILGLAALTREVGGLVLFAFCLYFILRHRSLLISLKKWWLIALFTFLAISPWTIRNYLVFEQVVLISTNGGINFYMGNNPEANGTYQWALPPGATWNEESPNGVYEIQASTLGYRHGLQFITENPGRFMVLVGKRIVHMLQPPYRVINFEESKLETTVKLVWLIMHVFLLIFAFVIGPVYLRRDPGMVWFWLVNLFVLLLPHLITYGATRYHVPMIPFMALITAIVLDKLFSYNRKLLILFTHT
jgi:4-amino-4-deoxy-L-arabinose transferase-like glycosyltransferase